MYKICTGRYLHKNTSIKFYASFAVKLMLRTTSQTLLHQTSCHKNVLDTLCTITTWPDFEKNQWDKSPESFACWKEVSDWPCSAVLEEILILSSVFLTSLRLTLLHSSELLPSTNDVEIATKAFSNHCTGRKTDQDTTSTTKQIKTTSTKEPEM